MKVWIIVITVLVVLVSGLGGVGAVVLLQVESQNKELTAALEKNTSKIEELYIKHGFYSSFFEKNIDFLKLVVAIKAKTIDGFEAFLANGFFADDYTIITAGHVVEELANIQSKAKEKNGSIYIEFPAFRNQLGSALVMPIPSDMVKKVSGDGLLAALCLSSNDAGMIRLQQFTYLKPAPKEKLKAGEIAARVSVNPHKLSSGTLFDFRIIEAVSAKVSHIKIFEGIFGKFPADMESNLQKFMVVSGGMTGDSGSPILVLDRDSNEFLVGGITEGPMLVTRSDVLSDFLNSFSCEQKSNSMIQNR